MENKGFTIGFLGEYPHILNCLILKYFYKKIKMYNFNLCGVCGKEMRFRHSSAKFCFPCADKRSKFNGGSRASYLVNKAIKEGLIKPVKEFLCIDCGAQATCYDHRDYNKPLEIDPVCSKCNKRRGPAIYLKTEEK